MFQNWQQKCEEFGKAQESCAVSTDSSEKGTERTEGWPEDSWERVEEVEARIALGEKCKARWENALPKRPNAGSLPLFKRESCLFYFLNYSNVYSIQSA